MSTPKPAGPSSFGPPPSSFASALRRCVHCGFCLATCPTYLERGDELDSPRGRIELMKRLQKPDIPVDDRTVRHLDRCLSCLACMTTCPSGVDYESLIDATRYRIEATYRRPWRDRLLRTLLSTVLTRPVLFRSILNLVNLGRPIAPFLPAPYRQMLAMAPARWAGAPLAPGRRPAEEGGQPHRRVALLTGCVQPALAPEIDESTVRLLTRLGCEVVILDGARCCGALPHHLGQERAARRWARANIEAWWQVHRETPFDALVINASGCGSRIKDYGRWFRGSTSLAEPARELAAMALDISELLAQIDMAPSQFTGAGRGMKVTYQAPCSLQHGQRVRDTPPALLRRAGFEVTEPTDAHLCCGSAGTYSILQPNLSGRLKERKQEAIAATQPEWIATGNIGCLLQLGSGSDAPVVHTVQLLDWATGGPRPATLSAKQR